MSPLSAVFTSVTPVSLCTPIEEEEITPVENKLLIHEKTNSLQKRKMP
jgi:hypothetical protein